MKLSHQLARFARRKGFRVHVLDNAVEVDMCNATHHDSEGAVRWTVSGKLACEVDAPPFGHRTVRVSTLEHMKELLGE